MRPALWSVAIQAAGSASTLGAALLVASSLGMAAQGEFGLLRSWSDALGTLAVIGLPQGLLHMQYREGVSVAKLRPWVWRYLVGLCAALIVAFCLIKLLLPVASIPNWLESPQTFWLLGLTVMFGASHLLWRSLALRDVGLLPYAALTAAPSLIVLVALVVVCALGKSSGLMWALLAGASTSAIASGWMVQRLEADAEVNSAWSRRVLWSVSSQTGVQNIFTALTPPAVLSTAAYFGASLAQVGQLSLGLHVYQVFGIAATYMAPMVYDKAARSADALSAGQLLNWMRERLTLRAVLAFALAVVAAMVLLRNLWPAGADSLVLVAAMASAGALSMAVRLMVTLLQARGAYRSLSWHALGRLLLSVGGSAAFMQTWPAALAVPVALLVTEVILLAWAWALIQIQVAA